MNIVAKIIAVKYPRGNIKGTKSEVMEIQYAEDIQIMIRDLLFTELYDYCVINYNSTLYITEKDTGDSYMRRTILYHPLQSELSL